MASPSKAGSQKHEIVARHDGYCCLCRGKTLSGTRIWWDGATGLVHHVECPPVAPLAEEAYRAPPVTPGRWKELCKQLSEMMLGGDCKREVVSEDVEAEACGAFGGMLANVMKRTRCTGQDAVEIVRRWKDKQRTVDEAKFLEVSRSCRREQPQGDGSPKTDEYELVDWDAEAV